MESLIFWLAVAAYWAVGIKRLPAYYRTWYDHDRKEWSLIHTKEQSQRSAAWTALGLAAIWPYYEGGRLVRDHIIQTMTADERRQAEYEAAERIVAEYKARKEREDREQFDKELNGGT